MRPVLFEEIVQKLNSDMPSFFVKPNRKSAPAGKILIEKGILPGSGCFFIDTFVSSVSGGTLCFWREKQKNPPAADWKLRRVDFNTGERSGGSEGCPVPRQQASARAAACAGAPAADTTVQATPGIPACPGVRSPVVIDQRPPAYVHQIHVGDIQHLLCFWRRVDAVYGEYRYADGPLDLRGGL